MSIRLRLCIFTVGFVIGTALVGWFLANHPQHLLPYLWPTLEARALTSMSWTSGWHVAMNGHSFLAWKIIAAWQMQNPDGYAQIMNLCTQAPLGGLFFGVLMLTAILYLDVGTPNMQHLRGRYLTSSKKLTATAKRHYGSGVICLDRIRWPERQESEGLLVAGATGKGKTTAIVACLNGAAQRGDRVIITDQNGLLMANYMASNRVLLLNPFDERSKDWSPLAEIASIHDTPRLAKSMVPDAEGTESRQWTMYAQQLLSTVLERLYRNPGATNADLLRFFRPEGQTELKALITGKSVSAIYTPGNERLAANVAGVLAMYLPSYEYLVPDAGAKSFSITRWIREGNQGWLWLTYREDQLDALRPLISTWVDIASTAVTSLPPNSHPSPKWQFWKEREEPRRIWNVIDEAASIGRIQSMEHSITVGRKAGLRTVVGVQSVSQLRELYGVHRTETILGSLNSAVIFGTQDPDTAEYLSRRIGDAEVKLTNTNSSRGSNDFGNSHFGQSTQRTVRRVVLPAQISALQNLHAYVALSGVGGVAKIKLAPCVLQRRIPSFISKPDTQLPPPPPPQPGASNDRGGTPPDHTLEFV